MTHPKPDPESRVVGLPLTRRSMLRCGVLGAAGLWLGARPVAAGVAPERPAPAKAVIQIWMWGGPAHLDTFDPKPDAGYDYCGPLNETISTNVDGIRLGASLPMLAKQADKYAIVRGMTHGVNGHETASYMVQTGRASGGRLVYPSVGAVVSYFRGYDAGYTGLIPPYIVLTQPLGRFSESGFLGNRYKPFATGGDPAQARFAVEGVVSPGISDERQRARRDLLGDLDTLGNLLDDDPHVEQFRAAQSQAYDLILGDAGRVFDLDDEKDALRDAYGRNTFGQSCLMARRLVERGVRYVAINYRGWDTHKQHFQTMRRKLPEMDRGFATLLDDLSERGLLESTIVWWGGEFGRTPRVQWEPPWNGGRNHFGRVFSSVLAGGGFQGGSVVGATDAKGEFVDDRAVYPCDLIGSIYDRLGIDPEGELEYQGITTRLSPAPEENVASAGRLTEIM